MEENHSESGATIQLAHLLELHRKGDGSAKDAIIDHACERLRLLASRMLRRKFPSVARWEQTDDVLQKSLMKLHHSLSELRPESVGQFMGLAALQIRRSLLDFKRKHHGPKGVATNHHSDIAKTDVPRKIDMEPAKNLEPESLDEWTAFLEAVENLPDDEKAVVDLIHLQGLTQVDAAEALGITDRTIRRRWQSARLLLHEALGKLPE